MAPNEYRIHVEIPLWKVRLWMLRGLLPVVFRDLPITKWPAGIVEVFRAVRRPPT